MLRERFLLLTPTLGHDDFDSFLRGKALWHNEIAGLKDSTLRKLRANLFLMLAEAGADWRHVAKMEFWTPPVEREALDPFWLEKFPDEASRPSRHTHVGEGKVATASFIAYVID